jgi:hypothetical protein
MRAATAAFLLAAACRGTPSAPADGGEGAQTVSCIERWLAQRELNQYGDPAGTLYTGGTPLFDERTGQTTERVDYLVRKHPELQQACPQEVLRAHHP